MAKQRTNKTQVAQAIKKSPLKKRMELIEKLATDGMDAFGQDVRVLYQNQRDLSVIMDELDVTLAAIRLVLVKKLGVSEDDIDAERNLLISIMEKKKQAEWAAMQAARAEAEVKAEAMKEHAAHIASGVDPELLRMKAACETTSEAHPAEAFMFGGS